MFYSNNAFSLLKINQGGINQGSGFQDTTSFLLDGTDEAFDSASSFPSLEAAMNYSISCWVYLTSLKQMFVYVGYDSGGGVTHYGYLRSTGEFYVWTGGSGSNWSRGTISVIPNQWNHLCMTLDRSLNRYVAQKVYVNGQYGMTSNYFGNDVNLTTSFAIGYRQALNDNFYDGNINEFAVWDNHTLSQSEITEIYNSGGPAIDLNAINNPPSSWYRSEEATWDGNRWTMTDKQGNETDMIGRNMQEGSRVNQVP